MGEGSSSVIELLTANQRLQVQIPLCVRVLLCVTLCACVFGFKRSTSSPPLTVSSIHTAWLPTWLQSVLLLQSLWSCMLSHATHRSCVVTQSVNMLQQQHAGQHAAATHAGQHAAATHAAATTGWSTGWSTCWSTCGAAAITRRFIQLTHQFLDFWYSNAIICF